MSSSGEQLMTLDATAQAGLVATREVSPLELIDAAIAQIEQHDSTLNAVVHRRFEQARREAAETLPAGPFRGVPLLLKDLGCPSKGDPFQAGMRHLRRIGFRADHDSALVTRYRAAGFVVLGRTNVPELGMSMTTEPIAFGPTRNPWNPQLSPGGSSGGSAAAVAAGMVAVAHATDGGGSLRIPASACGLVGLKPSRGRVSQGPDAAEGWAGALVEHALTRTVRDTAALLDISCGYATGDPSCAPALPGALADEVKRNPECLRIGFLDHPLSAAVSADVENARVVRAAATLLEQLGHDVTEDHPAALKPCGFGDHFTRVLAACCAADLQVLGDLSGGSVPDEDLEPGTRTFIELGRSLSATDYLAATSWLGRYTRRLAAWWEVDGFDLLVTPVLNGPPPALGWLTDPVLAGDRVEQLLQYLRQFNVSGQPAVSLPLGMTFDGLPLGVQLVAAYGREDLLIRVAAQLEVAAPWVDHRPPVYSPI